MFELLFGYRTFESELEKQKVSRWCKRRNCSNKGTYKTSGSAHLLLALCLIKMSLNLVLILSGNLKSSVQVNLESLGR